MEGDYLQEFINRFNYILTGPVMVWGVLLVGIILSWRTRFVQATKLPLAIKSFLGSLFCKKRSNRGITPFQAVATALSGTIGTGNIVGVATAITIGGAGAIFWMWISAFFGMATKYSEIVLAIRFRKKIGKNRYIGGPMLYLEEAVKGKWLSVIFAVLCMLSSFGIGNMVQANAISDAISSVSDFSIQPIMLGIALLAGFVVIGGIQRIARVTEAFIPAMALFYLVGCFIVVGKNSGMLGTVFAEIFQSAFQSNSVVGGISGFFMNKAMKIGFARGVFTNEAGLGSAPIAHGAADAKSPAQQGLLGIFEVFFDTVVMCTLTGVVILLSGLHNNPQLDGATLTLGAFEKNLGSFAAIFIAVSTVFFALAAIIGWSYYGQACVEYLFHKKKYVLWYKLCYVTMIYIGGIVSLELVWGISDLLNGLMMIPNLLGVVLLSGIVKQETQDEFG